MTRKRLLLFAQFGLMLLLFATAVVAGGAGDTGEAARQAAAMTGGRVLDVQPAQAGGRPVYHVRVLLGDGRVKVIRIEGAAADGRR